MSLYSDLRAGKEKLSLIGLGYVGMPIAVAFANENITVIGFDVNSKKIELYKSGIISYSDMMQISNDPDSLVAKIKEMEEDA